MKTPISLLTLALAAGFMAGCSDGGGSGGVADGGGGGGEAVATSFTALVEDTMTNDSSEPMGINEREITYDAQDNEKAFDEHLNP
jgi:hypothetical protein